MRTLNKHISSVNKVAELIPVKDFISKVVPVGLVCFGIGFKLFKINMFYSIIPLMIFLFVFFLYSESVDGENGIESIKSYIRYKKRGTVYFEKCTEFYKRGEKH